MTIPSSYDLPVSYDSWKQSQPYEPELLETEEYYTIEFGDDVASFKKEVNSTLTDAKWQAKRLFERFGYAILFDESGVKLEAW